MARYLLIALFVALAVCILQASAAPAEETTTISSIEGTIKQLGDNFYKGFQDAKPQLDEFLSKGKELYDSVSKKISEEAGKIIPASNDKPTA